MSKQQAVSNSSNKLRVSGVILIDKPQGMTSQQVVSKVKYLFKSAKHDSKKAGHTGTLDPMATGLLPVCFGEATKFSHYQLDANKSYQASICLGQQTDTGDAEGQVIATQPIAEISPTALQKVCQQFLGQQQQIPPMYSALKKEGKKLYEYARAGIEVERAPRSIVIYQLQLTKISKEVIKLQVTCSKGTYVRVLAEDIAQALGNIGHLTQLRRLTVGAFDVAAAVSLDKLEQMSLSQRFEQLLGIDACLADMPSLTLTEEQCRRLRLGQRLNVSAQIQPALQAYLMHSKLQHMHTSANVTDEARDIRLLNAKGAFVGLGKLSGSGRLQPKKNDCIMMVL